MSKVLVFMILVSLALGYSQEWLKVNVNNVLELAQKTSSYDMLSVSDRIELHRRKKEVVYNYKSSLHQIPVLFHLKQGELKKLKWVLAVLLVWLHYFINRKAVHLVNPEFRKMVFWVYAAGVGLIVGSILLGKLFSLDTYLYQRRLLGFLQSGVLIFFFIITEYIRIHVAEND